MEDRQEAAIARYDLGVRKRYRSRGGWMLDTGAGLKLLREYEDIRGHFNMENNIKEFLVKQGFTRVDSVVPNREGELVTELETGEMYVVYNWFSGEECNLRAAGSLSAAGENLGTLHAVLRDFVLPEPDENPAGEPHAVQEKLLEQFRRHNRELKRVNGYMKGKKRKSEFEIYAVNCFERYYDTAREAADRLENSSYYQKVTDEICHGDYNYHNLIMTPAGPATTGFLKAGYGIQLLDLTYFMRKTLEKNGWRLEAGEAVLNGYDKANTLTGEQLEFVHIMLMYPEKYWKLMNHYFNKKKSWLSVKSLEKLQDVRSLEDNREKFLQFFGAKY